MKFLLILDFDGCITCADDTLTMTRAENISDMIDQFREFDIGFMILTLANKAHVFDVVRRSGSKRLMDIFDSIEIIAIDERSHLVTMDKTRGESINEKNRMIRRVMESLYHKNGSSTVKNVPRDVLSKDELIQAYKKTKSLLTLATTYGMSHENIFFLDDNPINIKFANEHGFRAFYVFNHIKFRSMNTLYFLGKIYNWLSMIQMNNKKVDYDFLTYHRNRNIRSQSNSKQSDIIHDVVKYVSPQQYKRTNK